MAITSSKSAVLGARLLHHDLAVLLDDVRPDLARLPVDEDREVALAAEDRRRATSFTQRGQSESVSRGQPSWGKVRSRRLSSGAGAHLG